MDIVVKGRRTEVPERFRDHVADKLAKVGRLDHKVMRIDVQVSRERNPRLADMCERVELTCHSRGPVIRAEAAADDVYAALDLAWGKLEGRLRKLADRRRVHHGSRTPLSVAAATADTSGVLPGGSPGRPVPPGGESAGASDEDAAPPAGTQETSGDAEARIVPMEVDGDGPLVVREKVHSAKPMHLDQALFEMELVGHDFYLFVDAESSMPSVVYRRRGYDYGVIRLGA